MRDTERERERPGGGVMLAVLGWPAYSQSPIKASAAGADLWCPCEWKAWWGMERQLSLSRISYASFESHSPTPSLISWLSACHIVSLSIVLYDFLSYRSHFRFYFFLNSGAFSLFLIITAVLTDWCRTLETTVCFACWPQLLFCRIPFMWRMSETCWLAYIIL